jgi:hypothetical protein
MTNPTTVDVVTVTPKLARELLALNTHNRRIRARHVAYLAAEILGDRWCLTNDAVTISKSGILLNGQHRLMAIVEARRPAKLLILRGAEDASQVVTDIGNRRNLQDALAVAGFENLAGLASIVTFIFRMTDSELTFPATRAKKYPYQPQIDFAVKQEEQLTRALRLSVHVRQYLRFPGSIIGGLWYLQAELDQDDADAFWETIAAGVGLEEADPRLTWRRWVERQQAQSRAVTTTTDAKVALTIKAWNAWRAGANIQLLSWRPGGANPEPFPRLQ